MKGNSMKMTSAQYFNHCNMLSYSKNKIFLDHNKIQKNKKIFFPLLEQQLGEKITESSSGDMYHEIAEVSIIGEVWGYTDKLYQDINGFDKWRTIIRILDDEKAMLFALQFSDYIISEKDLPEELGLL